MKKHLNVLITGVGSTTALSVIKGLKKQSEFDLLIVGTDINKKNNIAGSNFCDKFYMVPLAIEEKGYINSLIDIIKSESIDLVIPIIDIELEIIAKNRNIIEKLTFLLLSSYETILTCNDKLETFHFFKSLKIPTPKTISMTNFDNIKDLLLHFDMTFPLVAKPRKGVSSRDVYFIQNEDNLVLIRRINDPIIQEKVNGVEYTIDTFYDGKKVISVVPRIRIETRAGISYKGQTVKDKLLISYAKKIVEELNIIGPSNIQCIKDREEVKFIEVNPRFSGSLPLTIAAGVNTPLFALRMASGEVLEPIKNFKKCIMCRYWEEMFYYDI